MIPLWLAVAASVCIAQTSLSAQQLSPALLINVPPISIALTGDGSRHDFGKVSPLDQTEIIHSFVLRNDSDHPLMLAHLQPSCSCTSAAVTVGTVTAYSREGLENVQTLPAIAPGQKFSVRVSVNPVHLAPGQIFKSVAVFVRGNPQPAITLEMTGTLLPSLTFNAPFLDFGKIAPAQARPQTLTVSLDARLAAGGKLPRLLSSNPDVQVKLLPAAETQSNGARMLTRRYKVSLAPDASLGPVSGTLSFAPPDATPTDAGSAPQQQARVAALTSPVVLLLGDVLGDIAALPETLAFGNVAPGQAVTRSILLTGSAALLSGISAMSDSPWLSVQFNGDARVFSGGQPATRALDVTLSPDAPVDALHGNIKITLSNGERLTIPMSAYPSANPIR